MVNVQYIHDYIKKYTNITVPIKAANSGQAANVKYLLAAIDKANELSPASINTDFKNHARATQQAVDTIATADATARLFNCNAGGYYKPTGATACANCGPGYYCPVNGNARNACKYGAYFCITTIHATDVVPTLPPTIDLTKCALDQPQESAAATSACLGVATTAGHWQLVDAYTGSVGDNLVKRAGAVGPGLYRVESYNRYSGLLGSAVFLVNKTMYYGIYDHPAETTARVVLSVKTPFTVGGLPSAQCNYNGGRHQNPDGQVYYPCYNGGAGMGLDDYNLVIDHIAGEFAPGITAANTTTPLGAGAIYRWVN